MYVIGDFDCLFDPRKDHMSAQQIAVNAANDKLKLIKKEWLKNLSEEELRKIFELLIERKKGLF